MYQSAGRWRENEANRHDGRNIFDGDPYDHSSWSSGNWRWREWTSTHAIERPFIAQLADLVLRMAWFRRVWAFQELVFSKDPRVQLGRHRMAWSVLCGILLEYSDALVNVEAIQGSQLLFEMNAARAQHQKTVEMPKVAFDSRLCTYGDDAENSLTMLQLLRARRGLGATDPKDMIFAHVGFASDGQALKQTMDYSRSCAQVYQSFAHYMISRGCHDELFAELDGLEPSARITGLPSWAPDWSKPSRPIRALPHFSESQSPKPSAPASNSGTSFSIILVQDTPVLACLGTELDIVAGCSDCLSTIAQLHEKYHTIWHVLDRLITSHDIRESKDIFRECENLCREMFVASYRAIHDGIWRLSFSNEETLSPLTTEMIERIWEELLNRLNLVRLVSHALIPDNFLSAHKALRDILDVDYMKSAKISISNSMLARMASGRFAFVPKWTKAGDVVCALILPDTGQIARQREPLVLRSVELKDSNIEKLIRREFRQQGIPITHYRLVGLGWLDTSGLDPDAALSVKDEAQAIPEGGSRPAWKIIAIH